MKPLVLLYVVDTALTGYAISHGTSIEVNPLYWCFHDSIVRGVLVRVAIGGAILYALHRYNNRKVIRWITSGYGALLALTTLVNFLVR